jgi:hypothetical protein
MLQKLKVKVMGVDLLVLWYLEKNHDNTDSIPMIDGIFVIDSKGNYHIDETPNLIDLVSVGVLNEIEEEIYKSITAQK